MTSIIRRKEAAQRLGVTPKTLDVWASEGILKKIFIPGKKRVRAIGFRSADVDRLVAGA